MSYEDRFELVRSSLISYCKECITENWEKSFDMWLTHEADMVFGHGYQDIFEEQFSQYMNKEIDNILWIAGKNIVFAIRAFVLYKDDTDLNDVLNFTGAFISEQLDDFDNWCDEIGMLMYKETPEYHQENDDRKEGFSL